MPSSSSEREAGLLVRTFRSFSYRNFRWLWFGAFTSTTGYWVAQVAESWYIYEQTSSETLLGLTTFLNGLPILMFSVWGGVLADRMDRRYLLIGSQVMQMTAAFSLAFLFFTARIEIWHILTAAFVAGLGQAFGGPAYQALMPSLVPRKHLPNAIALLSIQFNLAGFLGKPIGGAAFKFLSPAACFFINGLSFFAVILALLSLRIPFVPRPGQQNMFRSLLEGFRAVSGSHSLRSLMLLAVVTAFCGVPINMLMPVFAQDVFALDAGGYGMLSAVLSLGAILGALNVARLGNAPKKGRNSLYTQFFLGATLLVFGLTTQLWMAIPLLFIAGGTILAVFTMVTSLVQLNLNEELRGRIISVHNTAFRGAMPVSNLTCGFAAEKFGAGNVLSANGSVLMLVACWHLFGNKVVKEL